MWALELEKVVDAVNLLQESRAPDDIPVLRDFLFGKGFTLKAVRGARDFEELRSFWTPALEKICDGLTGYHDPIELGVHEGQSLSILNVAKIWRQHTRSWARQRKHPKHELVSTVDIDAVAVHTDDETTMLSGTDAVARYAHFLKIISSGFFLPV